MGLHHSVLREEENHRTAGCLAGILPECGLRDKREKRARVYRHAWAKPSTLSAQDVSENVWRGMSFPLYFYIGKCKLIEYAPIACLKRERDFKVRRPVLIKATIACWISCCNFRASVGVQAALEHQSCSRLFPYIEQESHTTRTFTLLTDRECHVQNVCMWHFPRFVRLDHIRHQAATIWHPSSIIASPHRSCTHEPACFDDLLTLK